MTGITISPSQHAFATSRLGDKAEIQLEDYRRTRGTFDAIVSIEMVEAVGEQYWPKYFQTIGDRLARTGRAVIQAIVVRDDIFDGYRTRSDFIRHYVFPGGMLPSHAHAVAGRSRACGPEAAGRPSIWPGLCARTLRAWSERMREQESEIRKLGHDEKFLRNWQFYFSGSARPPSPLKEQDVLQLEFAHS